MLYFEQAGDGVPILLIPPSGSTASTWGSAADELARVGLVIAYDRRGYTRSGGAPPHSMSAHTADAAALLEHLGVPPAVVVGTSAGAGIAIDLAVRRPDLVRAVIAHEFPWRWSRQLPTASQLATVAKIGSLVARGRYGDAAEVLLRRAYAYRDGGTAWDAFPEEWRRVGRQNARATLADFVNSIGNYPSATDLATITVPVVCSYGARSPDFMPRLVRSLASAIPGATTHRIEGSAHAAPFDATAEFVDLIAATAAYPDTVRAMGEITGERNVEIAAPIETCFAIAADIQAAPEWQESLKDVEVIERDPDKRASLVETASDAKVKTVKSTLRFTYDEPRGIEWVQEKGDVKSLEGYWRFEELGPDSTRATYGLIVDPGRVFGMLLRGPAEAKVRGFLLDGAAEGLKAKAEAG